MFEDFATSTLYEHAEHAARTIRAQCPVGLEDVRTAVVLGSGLGGFVESLQDAVALPYEEIPGFARSTVEGHAGRLVVGRIEHVPVAVMQGRFHFYEGYSLQEVTFPIRALGVLGARTLVLTNAAGGVNPEFKPGQLMLIKDHLNLMGAHPLIGANDNRFGSRFPDMTNVYDQEFRRVARDEAQNLNLELVEGVYAALTGPSYETPAEIRMLRTLGADAIGMSTVPEAIVARHMDIKILGLSCITNMAAGVIDQPINHDEVIQTGARVQAVFSELLARTIQKLHA